jgi:hypothetical protein
MNEPIPVVAQAIETRIKKEGKTCENENQWAPLQKSRKIWNIGFSNHPKGATRLQALAQKTQPKQHRVCCLLQRVHKQLLPGVQLLDQRLKVATTAA